MGTAHAFLILRELDGKLLATGDLVQVGHGSRITSHLTFHFQDGSVDDETTVFTQHKMFEFVSDHLVQRGPSFPDAVDATVLASGDVTIRRPGKKEADGSIKMEKKHLDIPPDTSNGMLFSLLMGLSPGTPETRVAMVVPTGKGRLVHLSIKPDGQDTFHVGAGVRRATVFRIHYDLGGVVGVIAPIVGKQPEDIRVWVQEGDAPTILKVEGQMYEGGPVWRMEIAAPVWGGK